MNDKNSTDVRLIEINHWPETGDHLTPRLYVDNVIRNSLKETSLLRLDPDIKVNLDERGSIILKSTLTSPRLVLEIPTKIYVDDKFNDPSVIKNTAHVAFIDKIFDNVRFNKVNSLPAVGEHLTAK